MGERTIIFLISVYSLCKTMTNDAEDASKLKAEIARLKENFDFLLHYYRMKVTEKTEELNKLKRLRNPIQ